LNPDEILQKIKQFVCEERNYILSDHVVKDYVAKDLCSVEEILYSIETADSIYAMEEDRRKPKSVDGAKYTIKGVNQFGTPFYTTGKFIETEEGESYFFITAHQNKN